MQARTRPSPQPLSPEGEGGPSPAGRRWREAPDEGKGAATLDALDWPEN